MSTGDVEKFTIDPAKGLDPDAEMKDSGVEWLGEVPAHWDVINSALGARNGRCIGTGCLRPGTTRSLFGGLALHRRGPAGTLRRPPRQPHRIRLRIRESGGF